MALFTFILFAGLKLKNDACKLVVPLVNRNGQLSSASTSATIHKDPTDQPLPPSLPPKELSPPPLPPKDYVTLSAVPSLPVQKTGSGLKQNDKMEAVMPAELPPQFPAGRAVNAASTANGNGNVYERPPRLSSLRVTGSSPNKGKKSLHNNAKQELPIPPWKAVVNLPCNSKDDNVTLPVLPEKQVLVLSSPSTYGDNSNNIFKKSTIRGHSMMTDKYISIHNEHSTGSINIFVSKPECIVESSDSSEEEEEEDECHGELKVISQPSLYDNTLVLSKNTSMVSPSVNGKEFEVLPDSIKNLSTAQKPPHGLPPLEFKYRTSTFPLVAPLSAPPIGIEVALPTSLVKCASSNGMSVLPNGITSTYSQLELPPKKMKQQV